MIDSGPDAAVEVGLQFRSDVAGSVTGIRFYKGTGNAGIHVGNLWTSNGTLLATATFTGETASGWQQVDFATPVAIAGNTVYVASYHTNVGHYSDDEQYFTRTGVDNPPLHALANSGGGLNGVYAYGSTSSFPDSTWNSSNYWVDVVFSPTAPILASIVVSPGVASVRVGATQQLTAIGTYSDGSTQDLTGAVTWSSSSPGIVTVTASGLATAMSPGAATLSAALSGIIGSATLSVTAIPLSITTASLAVGTQGKPYSASLTAQGGTMPYGWSIGSGLPPGLSLGSTTGVLSGTPTAFGTFAFTAKLTDASTPMPQTASANLSITIVQALTISTTSLPGGSQGVPYSAALAAFGGAPPYTWSIPSGLPPGLALDTATGAISGTPTAVGSFSFTTQVTDSQAQSASAMLAVSIIPSSTSRFTIWTSAATPSVIDSGPDFAVELGVKFRADAAGTVTGIRFYKSTANTGTHVGNLWTSGGTLLATATFAGETASGWQQVNFSSPVAIAANTVYVASYHTNVGHYSDDYSYFASAGVDSSPLHALQDGISGSDGVYAYGSTSSFPNLGYRSSNYWVDVVFAGNGSSAPDTTPPTLASFTVPATSTSLTVPITSFTATDNVGVTGYLLTQSASTPSPSAPGWAATTPTSYTFTAPGTQTLYAWAKDAAGNVSASLKASVAITLPGGQTIFFDDFTGSSLSPAWTVINRHGEYSQNETECNVPQQVSVSGGNLTITTAAEAWTCGDFHPDGSVWHTPSTWPFVTGDVQWTSFNFTYGTVEIRAAFPAAATGLWPATWLLTSACQATNPLTGETGVGTCPAIGTTGYTEIDMTECYSGAWCQFNVANPSFGIGCEVIYSPPLNDSNFHVFDTVWTPSSIKQYMDGNLVVTCNQSISTPMFLIMQTQTGGVGGTPNNADLPATLVIDYVKVTQP